MKMNHHQQKYSNLSIAMAGGYTTRQNWDTKMIKVFHHSDNHEDGYGDITHINPWVEYNNYSRLPNYWNDEKAISDAEQYLFTNGRYIKGGWDKDIENIRKVWQEHLEIIIQRDDERGINTSKTIKDATVVQRCEAFLKTIRRWYNHF
jgi:hypothetical protein